MKKCVNLQILTYIYIYMNITINSGGEGSIAKWKALQVFRELCDVHHSWSSALRAIETCRVAWPSSFKTGLLTIGIGSYKEPGMMIIPIK